MALIFSFHLSHQIALAAKDGVIQQTIATISSLRSEAQ
jgi:hypothetical protein